ncbi:type I restriction-modification system subunit M [Vibrio fluvialis]|nr:type I restriction-modification system subunit M [Vibrio fluvialis]ELW1730662.1 type I restriction-modification system subunit M [Vibrio fluvialis]
MVDQHLQELNRQVWQIANHLRGYVPEDEFRGYILGLIFYKYLSDKINCYANELLSEGGLRFTQIDEQSEEGQKELEALRETALHELGYFCKPSQLFHVLAEAGAKGGFILEDVNQALRDIEKSTVGTVSEKDFCGLFANLDLASIRLGRTEKVRNKLISLTLEYIGNINFEGSDYDVLGDSYEYLIGMFAAGSGKKAGEFYTPQMLSKLVAKLATIGNDDIGTVYDPACGSGSLLLKAAKESKNIDVRCYGQERNSSTYNLARMNMIMHGFDYNRFDIKNDDTLHAPQHLDLRFDAIVANPPFSMHWSPTSLHIPDPRFSEPGKLAPKTKADYAFIQHMLYQLNDTGTMAVVVPHGVLFRAAAEGDIRKFLIKDKNYLDMVIGLPSNIVLGTGVPVCILVFKKSRKVDDNVLFIDASQHFEKGKNANYLREEDLQRILNAVSKRESIDQFSYLASISDIAEQGYNLNISRYVDASPQSVYLRGLKEQLQEYEACLLLPYTLHSFRYKTGADNQDLENTLVISKTFGKTVKVHANSMEEAKDGDCVFVFNRNRVDSFYLELFFRSEVGQMILMDCAAKVGGAMKTFNLESLKSNLIASVPPLEVQKACVESNQALSAILEKLAKYKEDIIFKPTFSKDLLIRLDTTAQYVEEANYQEQLLNQIRVGENSVTEFKETFSLDVKRCKNNKDYKPIKESKLEVSSLKTIAGFLNSNGGVLFVGVDDDQRITGLKNEFSKFYNDSADKFLLYFKDKVKSQIGESFYSFIKIDLEIIKESPVLVVKCSRANQPCFLGKENTFYVRTPTGATDQLSGREMWDHLKVQFQPLN